MLRDDGIIMYTEWTARRLPTSYQTLLAHRSDNFVVTEGLPYSSSAPAA